MARVHAVQFGNNWMKNIPRTARIGRGSRPSPIWQSEEFVKFSYFQIGRACSLVTCYLYFLTSAYNLESTASSSLTGTSSKAVYSLRAKRHSLNTLIHVNALFLVFLFWFPSMTALSGETWYLFAGSLLVVGPQKPRQKNSLKIKISLAILRNTCCTAAR